MNRITDPEALEAWQKIKGLIFSTLTVILAVPVLGVGAFIAAWELEKIVAAFGIYLHYKMPAFVHSALLLAVVVSLLGVIGFTTVMLLLDLMHTVFFKPRDEKEHSHKPVPASNAQTHAALAPLTGDAPSALMEKGKAPAPQQQAPKTGINKRGNVSARRKKRLKHFQRRKNRH